jgi:hypothetical protein
LENQIRKKIWIHNTYQQYQVALQIRQLASAPFQNFAIEENLKALEKKNVSFLRPLC